jgi:hypothetical protein
MRAGWPLVSLPDFAIMASALSYRKATTVKYLYPCQYPGCQAQYDETLDGKFEGTGGQLTGWLYPQDAESDDITPTHDHIVNVMHRIEVEA